MSSTLNWLMGSSEDLSNSALLILIRLTLILMVAWLCHCACSRWNPRLRILLWRMMAVSLIFVTVLSLLPYRLQLALLPAASPVVEVDEVVEPPDLNETSAALELTVPLSGPLSRDIVVSDRGLMPLNERPPIEDTAATQAFILENVGTQETALTASWFPTGLSGYVCVIWGLGGALLTLSWLGGVLSLVALYRRATPVPAEIQDQADAIAAQLGYLKSIDVRCSEEVQTPFIVGAWRPGVLIPVQQCAAAERQELQASLAHEIAHCRGNDLRWHHIFTLLQILLWFHPLMWRTRVVHADACDELCDLKAAGYLGDDKLYGRLLAGLALRVAERNRSAALAMARRSQVRKRIEAVSRNRASRGLNRWQAGSMLTTAVAMVVLLGVVRISRAQEQPTEAEDQPQAVQVQESEQAQGVKETLSGTGEPGATVKLYRYPERHTKPVFQGKTTIDDNGHFTFKDVQLPGEGGRLTMVATKAGFTSAMWSMWPEYRRSKISLRMKSDTAALSGTITDENGNPVADAVVTLQPDQYPIPGFLMAKTDSQGRYTIKDLNAWNSDKSNTKSPSSKKGYTASRCLFRVHHADYPITIGSYSQLPQTVDVTLHPPAIVEGQVVDLVTGEPLADVEVHAQGIARHGGFTTRTDANGNYKLRMTNDYYNIWAIAPERMPLAIKALKVTEGQRQTGRDIPMARGGYVTGKVIDPATDQPIDGDKRKMQVAHHGPARPMTGAAVTSTRVRADGTYRLHVAPGRNYIYLMNGSSTPGYLKVGDGQTVHRDIVIGELAEKPQVPDPDLMLRSKLMRAALVDDQRQSPPVATEEDQVALPSSKSIGKLLAELKEMNSGSDRFSDEWANQLRKIASLGPEVVPELVAELDQTSDDMMLRCLGFILRAIGDKRAVPGLIRGIPKTLIRPGSDMGLQIRETDVALLKFMQQHDLSQQHRGSEYGFGRPVREIFGALESLTGQNFGDQELNHIFLNEYDFPSQKQAKAALFHQVAARWAQWWEKHAQEFTDDPAFYQVNLPPLPAPTATDSIPSSALLKTKSGTSGWVLQSIRSAPEGLVFYDLDTGRATALPERWRNQKLSDELLKEIREWAAGQGYDMLGDEIKGEEGQTQFVLRPIGLRTWELPKSRWKETLDQTSIDALQAEGRANQQDLLVSFDPETSKARPLDTVTFFYITREGTPGILYVGIEVQDDSLKPGGFMTGDNELNPVAFRKGRRFGLNRLVTGANLFRGR
ncbi:MAG: carboxypeptidase regulatory-like domain-containing protein [bacterium]|nr:carboxypeptidase regulatory-like domain-containing protein [bacterium]